MPALKAKEIIGFVCVAYLEQHGHLEILFDTDSPMLYVLVSKESILLYMSVYPYWRENAARKKPPTTKETKNARRLFEL